MKPGVRNGILAIGLLAFGAARMPFESSLARELRGKGLLPPPLAIGTSERIGQTSTAVALGGLRTLVAAFLNLRAFGFFEDQKWPKVADTFEIIVDLAPRTRYYWETGSWHSAYNAASYYLYESKMPSLRRREAWRASIVRGRAFLERGIRNNPDDWSLLANLGSMLADPNKFPAFRDPNKSFADSAEAFRRSTATGNSRPYTRRFQFYSLARVAGREAEALALGRELYEDPNNRTTTMVVLLFVLEAHENPGMDTAKRALELFGSPENAYKELSGHWQRTRERFPVHGVAAALESLEKTLNIPPEKSIFQQALPPPRDMDDWFSK